MFKLHRLELSGFKSFVDPVSLNFSGGLNGIVGPNGCGKSNVCDAVCWVLGERSAKNLRGETMEDVIFSGSDSRKSLGMAEVELTLSTETSYEHAQDGLITIGRRLHRSGESQYLLNGKTVRLKDVRDLLMDTGLGIRAYSVIEQGKIGMILSGKPQERRRLIEEAAGITKYKERRRIAEIKLEEARDNLSRLDDILSEVERSLRSLKRQAGAARRFNERKEAHQSLFETVLLGRWTRLHASLSTLEAQLRTETDGEAQETAELQKLETNLVNGREGLDRQSAELAELHRTEAEFAARIEGKQEFLRGSKTSILEVDERLKQGEDSARTRGAKLEVIQSARTHLEGRLAKQEEDRASAASEVSEDELKIDEVVRAASEAEDRLETLRNRLLHSIADLNGLRSRLHQENVEQEKSELRRKHLAEEFDTKLRELQQTTGQVEQADNEYERLATDVEQLQRSLDERDRAVADRTTKVADFEKHRSEVQESLRSFEKTRDVLEELERAQTARREGLAEVFERAGLGSPTLLADQVTVPEGWERSIDLYLGSLADAVVVAGTAEAAVALNALTDSALTAGLISTDGEPPFPVEVEDPAVGASLAEALSIDKELASFLPPAFLVESPDDARRLAARYPGVSFITRDRLWAESGILHVQGRNARPGTLTREHDLAATRQEIVTIESTLADFSENLRQERIALEQTRRDQTEIAEELAGKKRDLAVVEALRADLTSRQKRLSVEHQTVTNEQGELGQALDLIGERTSGLTAELDRSEALHGRLEQDFDEVQKAADRTRSERESIKTTGASRRGHLDLIDHRMSSLRSDLKRSTRDLDEAVQTDQAWQAEKTRLEQRKSELLAAVSAAEEDLQEALEGREAAQQQVLDRQQKLDGQRQALDKSNTGLESARKTRDESRDRISELRVRQAAVKQNVEHLSEQFREACARELPGEPPLEPEDFEGLEVELARLKEQLDRTGPVNLLAAEEFSEQEERHKFLFEQRTDVANSVDQLKQTIHEINETSSKRFLETFMLVNGYFGTAFQALFRGGQADMRLMDEDEPLECAIEIVARPPGKRLQNIMLMSGGEKALTAIALLFALFQAKPSPFCILDEVDAPLDDINTLRFVELLKKMSSDTQFIVITHNKLTMEATNRLYGVTMQERGVSRLVSVELEDIHPEALTAASA